MTPRTRGARKNRPRSRSRRTGDGGSTFFPFAGLDEYLAHRRPRLALEDDKSPRASFLWSGTRVPVGQDLAQFFRRRARSGEPIGLYGASCRKKFKNLAIHVLFRACHAVSLSQARTCYNRNRDGKGREGEDAPGLLSLRRPRGRRIGLTAASGLGARRRCPDGRARGRRLGLDVGTFAAGQSRQDRHRARKARGYSANPISDQGWPRLLRPSPPRRLHRRRTDCAARCRPRHTSWARSRKLNPHGPGPLTAAIKSRGRRDRHGAAGADHRRRRQRRQLPAGLPVRSRPTSPRTSPGITIQVIGIGITAAERPRLACFADATGGHFYDITEFDRVECGARRERRKLAMLSPGAAPSASRRQAFGASGRPQALRSAFRQH